MPEHVIKRLTFSLQFPVRDQAVQLQHEVTDIYRRGIEPLLDERFSRLADADADYRIEKLELDLGRINPENLRNDMVERVARQLENIVEDGRSCAAYLVPKQERQLDLFRHFIETGTSPWWAGKLGKHELERLVEQLCIDYPDELGRLLPDLVRDGNKIKRLVNQFSDKSLSLISRLYLPESEVDRLVLLLRDTETLFAELKRRDGDPASAHRGRLPGAEPGSGRANHPGHASSPTLPDDDYHVHAARHLQEIDTLPGRIELRTHYWSNILSGFFHGPAGSFNPRRALRETIASLTGGRYGAGRRLLARLGEAAASSADRHHSFSTALAELVNKLLADSVPGKEVVAGEFTGNPLPARHTGVPATEHKVAAHARTDTVAGNALPVDARNRLPGTGEAAAAGRTRARDTFTDADEDYVHNAGLAILWPYLPRFFTHLGLADGNSFIDNLAAERAVLLLQRIVEPDLEIPESLLSLNKLLCGLELHRPLPAEFTPTEREQGECDALFRALQLHWNILADMSAGQIRANFLRRQGILRPCAGNWQLQVESRTLDILMQKLPWPIGVVKLPWMDYAILVHWG